MSLRIVASAVSGVLERLEQVRQTSEGWCARCPAHDDRIPSLCIAQGQDGRILLKCQAGCSAGAIVQALGLRLTDLFPPRERPGSSLGEIIAHYDYGDEKGRLLFQVVRFSPKTFRQRRPDGAGGWKWGLGNVQRVLYRLPQLLAASAEETVFLVEGEKDADALAGLGVTATTNPGGAGKWRSAYHAPLRDRHVCVLPDNDPIGRDHAASVAHALVGVAARVRVLELPGLPPKGDVSDWLKGDGSKAALLDLAAHAPSAADWVLARRETEAESQRQAPGPLLTRLADVAPRCIHWLWPGRLALGKLAIFDGDPGLGKSLLTLDLCARVTTGRAFPDQAPVWPGDVVIVNCEDGIADTIRPRLEGLGADLNRVHLLRGPTVDGRERLPSLPRDLARLERALRASGAVLVVIDPIMAFLDETICSSNDQSVRQALAPLAALAESVECAVLLVRHLNKNGGSRAVYRGGGSIGIVGACRSAWMVARHPDNDRQRVLAQIKNNLAPPQSALAYEIVNDAQGRPQVSWQGAVDLGADELVSGGPAAVDGGQLQRAVVLLQEALAEGPLPAADLAVRMARQGITRRTLFRARHEAGILSETEKTPTGLRAIWRLPPPPQPDSKLVVPESRELLIPPFIREGY
jgi:putative DNA primase/helicase